MNQRMIPYGYRMKNGLYYAEPSESAVVRRIFTMRLSGLGVCTIGRQLYQERLPFFDSDRYKAIKKVSAILYKDIYCGQKDYPALIDAADFQKVQAMKKTLPCVEAKQNAADTVSPASPSVEWVLTANDRIEQLEAAIRQQMQQPTADIETVQTMIMHLAAEKYHCIVAKERSR